MAAGSQGHQIHVLLKLHNGERSFGMSLAQRSPTLGSKYTVVSSVFANSPADRAGVRKGYVVRCINDKPMGGLTVAQVANHFRNVGQAKITLEVVESAVSPRTSAFTAAATFGGVVTLPNRSTTQNGGGATTEQRPKTPVTGFSAVSSGRAIAVPGSALAVPTIAAPKQPVLRNGTKPAAKALGIQPGSGVGSGAVSSADAKMASDAKRTGLKSKAVAPVLRLGLKPKHVQSETAAEKMTATTTSIDPKPASKSVPKKPSSVAVAVNHPASSKIPQSPVQTTEAPRSAASAQVGQATQPKTSSAPALSVKVVAHVPTPPKPTAAKARAPIPASSPSVGAEKTITVPASLPMEAKSAAVTQPTGNTSLQPSSRPPSSAQSSGARNLTSTPALIASNPTAAQIKNAVPEPEPAPEPAAASARRRTPSPPVVIPPMPSASSTRGASSIPVRSTESPARSAARSTPPTQAPTVPKTGKTGKKRGRPRKNPAASNGTTSTKGKGKGKAKKAPKHQLENDEVDAIMDDEDVFGCYTFTSDSDLEESPSTTGHRTAKTRRRGVTDRTRHSLTVDRLVGMGFTQEDAEASVKEIGDDPDACMIWIISKIEERNFNEDLNRASIQSEQSKRDEEKRMKKREEETLAHAEKFMALFPTSYIVCAESTASRLKKCLQSTIDRVNADAYLRTILSKLLTLEGKSIRWYKEATRSYMLELAGRLDAALGTHDVMKCCARVSAINGSSPNGSCAFVRKVLEEVNALTKALFEMSTNQGGVPPVFLACDKTTQFDLEDDGFEVVE